MLSKVLEGPAEFNEPERAAVSLDADELCTEELRP